MFALPADPEPIRRSRWYYLSKTYVWRTLAEQALDLIRGPQAKDYTGRHQQAGADVGVRTRIHQPPFPLLFPRVGFGPKDPMNGVVQPIEHWRLGLIGHRSAV